MDVLDVVCVEVGGSSEAAGVFVEVCDERISWSNRCSSASSASSAGAAGAAGVPVEVCDERTSDVRVPDT